jgi:ElaA protein
MKLREVRGSDLDAASLHAVLQLRVAIFVVEQRCAYPELDGRDLDAGVRHCWFEEAGRVLAYLRIGPDEEGDGHWLRRVCTAADARGHGLARRLVEHALATTPGRIRIAAQDHLAGWYAGFGFQAVGAPYDDDGIAHVDMLLER